MNELDPAHPSAAELRAFSLGRVGEDDLARIAAHLDDCPTCRGRVDGLCAQDPLLTRLQAADRPGGGFREDADQRRQAARALRHERRRPLAGEGAAVSDLTPFVDRPTAVNPVGGPAEGLAPEGVRAPGPSQRAVAQAGCPRQIGEYDILGEVGRGGMGVVYKARHRGLRRLAAVKMVLQGTFASARQLLRFQLEAELAARVQHPSIVQVHEIGSHEGQPFLAMEWVEGGSLADRVDGHPWPAAEAARLIETLAYAIHAAHSQGVIHRDLKPANVLLQSAAEKSQISDLKSAIPKITDFGLARPLQGDEGLTKTGTLLGTPGYMAPEQASGTNALVGPATDVFALGVMLYELLTGQLPFQGKSDLEVLRAVTSAEPVRPRRLQPGVPRDLEAVVLKCLEKEPGRRYPLALELAEDLRCFLDHKPVKARGTSVTRRLGRWARRNRGVAALLAALFTVLVVGLALVIWQWDEAVWQRRRAEAKTQDEARARVQAERYAAGLLLERGQGLCRQGEYAGGLLWLARGLELVPDEDGELRDSLHTLLGAWSTRLCPCRLVLDHPGGVKAADLSADGRFVATACGDVAQVWEAETGRPVGPPLRHAGRVRAVALGPDGRLLLTGGDDNVARLWETATGRPVGGPLAHGGAVEHVAFSPDGAVALTAAKDGTARLWDTATGAALGPPMAHTDAVLAVAFSPDGRLAATGSNDATARLWDVPSGRPHGDPLRHEGAVLGLAFSPDGRQLLAGSQDKTARLWDVGTGHALHVFRHARGVPGVAFRPDGQAVATGSEDFTAREWDVRTGQPLGPPLRHDDKVGHVAYGPDGRLLLTAMWKDRVFLWEAGSERPAFAPLRQHGDLSSIVLGRDGGTVLTAGADHTARLWRVPGPLLPVSFPRQPGPVLVTAFGPDGTALLAAGGKQAWLFKADTGAVIAGPLDHDAAVLAGAVSPDGRTLLTGDHGGSAWLWDAATGRRLAGPFRHADPVWAVAFRPDGQAFATGSGHSVHVAGHMLGVGEARVWDVATGEVIQSAPRHARDVIAVAFTPDGRTLVTAGKDKTARFWDAATGAAVGGVIRHDGWVNALALGPDGRAVLTGSDDTTARLWSVPDAAPLTAPLRHTRPVKAVGVSPDGRLLLTASEDATAQLWEARRGQPAGEPLRAPAPIQAAALSPAGGALVTGDHGGGLRLWGVPAPLGGDVERVRLWVETTAGTELDATGALRPLEEAAWGERRRRLAQPGGAQSPASGGR
jgi:WD40 repeat protein/tRNA A-37 threonylcarbamoyl transferase component Bud32